MEGTRKDHWSPAPGFTQDQSHRAELSAAPPLPVRSCSRHEASPQLLCSGLNDPGTSAAPHMSSPSPPDPLGPLFAEIPITAKGKLCGEIKWETAEAVPLSEGYGRTKGFFCSEFLLRPWGSLISPPSCSPAGISSRVQANSGLARATDGSFQGKSKYLRSACVSRPLSQ